MWCGGVGTLLCVGATRGFFPLVLFCFWCLQPCVCVCVFSILLMRWICGETCVATVHVCRIGAALLCLALTGDGCMVCVLRGVCCVLVQRAVNAVENKPPTAARAPAAPAVTAAATSARAGAATASMNGTHKAAPAAAGGATARAGGEVGAGAGAGAGAAGTAAAGVGAAPVPPTATATAAGAAAAPTNGVGHGPIANSGGGRGRRRGRPKGRKHTQAASSTPTRRMSRRRSKYHGVSTADNGMFRAQIFAMSSMVPLGEFKDEATAARAYDKVRLCRHLQSVPLHPRWPVFLCWGAWCCLMSLQAARRYHKAGARLNFPNEQPEDDHNEVCEACDKGGELVCCDTCNLVFHLHCLKPALAAVPEGAFPASCVCVCVFCLSVCGSAFFFAPDAGYWQCPVCVIDWGRGTSTCYYCGTPGFDKIRDFRVRAVAGCAAS